MLSKFDVSKVKGPYPLLAMFLLVINGLLGYWFFRAEGAVERVLAGLMLLAFLAVFVFAIIAILKLQRVEPRPQSSVVTEHPDFKGLELEFLPECRSDLIKLNLDEQRLVRLVAAEFSSHMNYLRFDLEDYVMPLKASYLVYFDKIGFRLSFKRIFTCTRDEAKLASWNDILTLYRRATRLTYRNDPDKLVTDKSMLATINKLHNDMLNRIGKHFKVYEGIPANPLAAIKSFENAQEGNHTIIPNDFLKDIGIDSATYDLAREILFYVHQSISALEEIDQLISDNDVKLLDASVYKASLVVCVEKSLQYIHKILIRFPPIA